MRHDTLVSVEQATDKITGSSNLVYVVRRVVTEVVTRPLTEAQVGLAATGGESYLRRLARADITESTNKA